MKLVLRRKKSLQWNAEEEAHSGCSQSRDRRPSCGCSIMFQAGSRAEESMVPAILVGTTSSGQAAFRRIPGGASGRAARWTFGVVKSRSSPGIRGRCQAFDRASGEKFEMREGRVHHGKKWMNPMG